MEINEKSMWSGFHPVSKEDWLNKIQKDLKGRDIKELDVLLSNLKISPFAHGDDFLQKPNPVKFGTGNWLIGEELFVQDNQFKPANKILLDALMRGVQSPIIRFDDYPSFENLEILLEGVELDYVSLNFSEKTFNKNPKFFLENFVRYAELLNKNPKTLNGSIYYDPFADGRYERKTTLEALEAGKNYLSLFKIICVNGQRFFRGADSVVEELTHILLACNNYFSKLIQSEITPKEIAQRLIISCSIGTNYFVEIAKLRALRILWQHLLISYDTTLIFPAIIEARIQPQQKEDSPHQNKISASSQIMSAVIGGADYICTDMPIINDKNIETVFDQRILTNIQHLLSLESYFDRVSDPLAGSYYIELLTHQIAEASWENFKNLAQ